MGWAIYGMIFLGSALMIYNIGGFIGFAARTRRITDMGNKTWLLQIPIILLVLFFLGYVAVGLFGKPDLIVSGILFGGSVFVFIMYRLLCGITTRIKDGALLQTQLMAAEESNRTKSAFLASVSHEMRTPLNVILGLDTMALKDPELPSRTREQLEKIGASARHLLGLINDILDMSRIESGRMVLKDEEFSFREFLDQINIIINGQCQDKGLHYECQIVGKVGDYYRGDDMKLKQVLINILGNAVKFTDPPGEVTLTAEQVGQDENGSTLRFIIQDTGIGMDKEYIPKIFEAFSQEDATTTNRFGGSGLGMAITKNFVEMMNGDIAVESEKPAGYYDVILMDVRMPVMDGLSATEAIRALERPDAKTIPIIAMTANVFDEDVERSLKAGMNAHLSKPIEPDRLYATMARFIAESGHAGA